MRLNVFLKRSPHSFRLPPRLFCGFTQAIISVLRYRKRTASERNNGFGVQPCGRGKPLTQLAPDLAGMVIWFSSAAALFMGVLNVERF
jgi:hypothetical protein